MIKNKHKIKDKLTELKKSTSKAVDSAVSLEELRAIKVDVLGKKGALTQLLKGLKDVDEQERPKIGQMANAIKSDLLTLMNEKERALSDAALEYQLAQDQLDMTLPAVAPSLGHAHPIQLVTNEIVTIFDKLGFSVKEGPDIETNYYNFETLNIPADHPARDMHDTFYLEDNLLLRTHTSPVQIRTMFNQKPPLRILAPGKVFRCDADPSHSPVFHQIEGLYVDNTVSFAQLKGSLEYFLHELFGKDKKVRFRPSYFPFTEPSTEVDVEWQGGWMEILGAGLVHRDVFRQVGYDPADWTGFAFGMGIERIAMLKYDIPDIRLLYDNDQRFLRQF